MILKTKIYDSDTYVIASSDLVFGGSGHINYNVPKSGNYYILIYCQNGGDCTTLTL